MCRGFAGQTAFHKDGSYQLLVVTLCVRYCARELVATWVLLGIAGSQILSTEQRLNGCDYSLSTDGGFYIRINA